MKNKKEDTSSLITIHKDNFSLYFENPFSGLLNNKIDKQTINEEFYNLSNKKSDEIQNNTTIASYGKLLENIQCPGFEDTNYYKNFITNLSGKPAFFTLLLLPLLKEDICKNTFKRFIKAETTNKDSETPSSDTTDPVFGKYAGFLKKQSDIAYNIFKGVFELAKNMVEHSTSKGGEIKIESVTQAVLRKNQNYKASKTIWDDYFTYIGNKSARFLNISIKDTGTTGIIETSLRNMQDSENWRDIESGIRDKDISVIENGIKSCAGDNNKEARLLFDMYFNGGKSSLNRQAYNQFRGYGIFLFTKYINDNNGMFNVQTNKFGEAEGTISFSYRKGSDIKPSFVDLQMFGTSYNIIIPLRGTTGASKPDLEDSTNPVQEEIILSKGVYEKMLPLERRTIRKNEKKYSLGELNDYPLSKYIVRDKITKKDEILVFSLKQDENKTHRFSIDQSKLFRTLSRLFNDDQNARPINTIVIKDAPDDLIKNLFEFYTTFAPSNAPFFPEEKILLLIAENDDDKEEKPQRTKKKLAVITGDTINDCKKINRYIALKNKNLEVFPETCSDEIQDIKEKEKISEILDKYILFSTGQLIAIDFFEQGDSYFEDEAKEKLENLLDEEPQGYKWEHTHLKIGSKLHLDDFIYGKKMFQRSGEASKFAFSIARDIFENIIKETKDNIKKNRIDPKQTIYYTLVGYGYYSELLVSRTCDFINKLFSQYKKTDEFNNIEINFEYIIIKDEDKIKFSRYIHNFEERKNENTLEKLIIIVPISSTLTTCLKIENTFYKVIEEKQKNDIWYNPERFEIKPLFYTTVIVGDGIDIPEIQKNIKRKKTTKEIENKIKAVKSVWNNIKLQQKIIVTQNRENGALRDNKYNIYIKSQWRLPENCEHCFPASPIEERPLFLTDKVSVTPSLVFDSPKWYKSNDEPYFWFKKENGNTTEKKKPDTKLPVIDDIDWVHYTGDNNKHFNYYLHYLDVLHTNRDKLEEWTNKIKGDFSSEKEENVLLIAPDKAENGAFIHLINRNIFDDKAEIIRFDKHSDHYLNFDKFFKDKIKWANTIYFVDNLMLSGKTFLSVDEILKVSQEEITEEDQQRIKGIFCLINRMDYSCYYSVIGRLEENNRKKENDKKNEGNKPEDNTGETENNSSGNNNFYPFIQLNVPESIQMPCPLCDEKEKYEELKNTVSLDCIKQYFVEKEMPYFKEVDKENLIEYELPYNPLNKNHNSTLLKVALIHFLNKALAEYNENQSKNKFISRLTINKLPAWKEDGNNKADYEEYLRFNDFCDDFRSYIEKQKTPQSNLDEKENNGKEVINEFKFKANLIKVLSSQLFKKYRGIYISVFYWVLCELISAATTILGDDDKEGDYPILKDPENKEKLSNFSILVKDDFSTSREIDLWIDSINYLRLIVKVASSLNVAYLFHKDFLNAINKIINRTNKVQRCIRYGCYKLKPEEGRDLLKKYREMRYSFDNFKIFCAAHIIRSLHKNEQRAIKFEKNINTVYSQLEDKKDSTFLELLILENTGIIRQTLNNIKDIKDIDGIEAKNNPLLVDFSAFYGIKSDDETKENNVITKIKAAHKIQRKIKEYEKRSDLRPTDFNNDKEIKDIVELMAEIVGCNTKTGGGILLYKYQNLKDPDRELENYIVVGKFEKDGILSSYFDTQQPNNFTTKFLKGINYLTERRIDKTSGFEDKITEYKWINYAIHKDDSGNWIGKNGEPTIKIDDEVYKYSEFADIQSIDEKANRILFLRISSYHPNKNRKDHQPEEYLKGEAVFVFYDNDNNGKKPDCVHNTRFVHVLRNEISEYLKKKYRNDAFKAWVEERKFLNAPDHNYYNILSELKECRDDKDKYEFFYTLLMVKKDIHEILKTKNLKPYAKEILNFNLKDQIEFYCSNMFKRGKTPVITGDAGAVKFYEPLFRHIMYEYLRNARKGAMPEDININISHLGNNNYKISIENKHESVADDNKLLKHRVRLQQNGYFDSSKIKGLYLNFLLLEAIGCPSPSIYIDINNDITTFTVEFTLNSL